MQADSFTARARINGMDYDNVVYQAEINYAQQPLSGRSLELRAIGFNNEYGANWRASCYNINGTSGTPGFPPYNICTAVTDSDISGGSCGQTYNGCTINGAAGTDCATDGSYCDCPDDGRFVGDYDTCTPLVLPVPVGCTTSITKWWDGKDYIIYQWPRVRYDGKVLYEMTDASASSSDPIRISGYGNDNEISNSSYSIDLTVYYTSPIEKSTYSNIVSDIDCGIPITWDPSKAPSMSPTSPTQAPIFPTTAPTLSPSDEPTNLPSISPTYPTDRPSSDPTIEPTMVPTLDPTFEPTINPLAIQLPIQLHRVSRTNQVSNLHFFNLVM